MMKLNNTALRIIVSLLGIPIILGFCLWGGWSFVVFVGIISLTALYEFSLLLKGKGILFNYVVGFLSVIALLINVYLKITDTSILLVIIFLLLFFYELFRNKGSAILNTAGTALGIIYLGFFTSHLILLRELYTSLPIYYERGGHLIITLMATIWICDSAAYFIGISFGKHKLFPRVSPKKSWEGAIAGFIFSVIAAVAAKYLILDFMDLDQMIIIGMIIGIVGQSGDLIESLFKRDAEVKDSSAILPGHGGFLDRFDSLIISAPVIYLFIILTN